jgi:SRSO17 transposase
VLEAAKAEHRIEECIQRCKSETGLADYEVRNWNGWHHHQILSLLAAWFLTTEARRGKKIHPGDHGSADSRRHQFHSESSPQMRFTPPHAMEKRTPPATQRARSPIPLETT